ncbi:MAG: VWA domain-containing protein, partial [Rhodospirillaceae bacterium]|nr:VWA domain-containing protein [Rhodospirillaceae bacterium]
GVFVLLAVLLFPYYLKRPALKEALEGAQAYMRAAQAEFDDARAEAGAAADALAAADAARSRAQDSLAEAELERREAETDFAGAAARAKEAQAERQSLQDELANLTISDLDIVFVMDVTGSMRHELADIRANLVGIVRTLNKMSPTLQVGFVAFKDRGEDFVTKAFSLRPTSDANLEQMQRFVESFVADGGGDDPEAVGAGLRDAVDMSWRAGVRGRIVVIGDAPPRQGDWGRDLAVAQSFAASGAGGADRRISSIFTGNDRSGEEFYRQLARSGGGDFMAHRGRMVESVMLSILEPSGKLR